MKKKRHWTELLSAPVRLRLEARVKADGYDADPDAWVSDLVATAMRSPQGFVLRFGKMPSALKSDVVTADQDLFNQTGGEA